jgi:hypothetical protein
MPASPDVQNAVDTFRDAANSGNPARVIDLVASTDDVLGIGSDPDEWWPGSDRLRSIFEVQLKEMAGAKFEFGELHGSGRWGAAQCAVVMPDGTRAPARLTIVCTEDGKIEHFHFSVGVPNEETIGQELTT